MFETNLRAVENTIRALDQAMIEVAARAIAGARRIDIYGVGYSYFSGLDAKLKLVRFGLTADAYGAPHLQVMAAVSLMPGDVAIGISHSGSTRDVVDALGPACKSGSTTIAITNYSPSPIPRIADVVLLTSASESPPRRRSADFAYRPAVRHRRALRCRRCRSRGKLSRSDQENFAGRERQALLAGRLCATGGLPCPGVS